MSRNLPRPQSPPLPARSSPALPVATRRQALACALLAGLAGIEACAGGALAMATPSAETMLGGPDSYARERRIAMERHQPLLLFFSLAGCAYCEALRQDQLRHVHSRQERLGVRIVELRMDDARPVPGLEPARSPRQIANALQVRVAPTVVFLDGEREIAERLVGYASPDFYGAYLDGRIARARAIAGAGSGRRPAAQWK